MEFYLPVNVPGCALAQAVISGVFACLSAYPVVYFSPAVAGGGIAEVMAYLNGIWLPKVLTKKCVRACGGRAAQRSGMG